MLHYMLGLVAYKLKMILIFLQPSNTLRVTAGLRAFIPPPDSLESQLEASGITIDNYNLSQKLESISKDRRKKNHSTFYVTGRWCCWCFILFILGCFFSFSACLLLVSLSHPKPFLYLTPSLQKQYTHCLK